MSRFELAAMSRATMAEPDRRDFFLYIDEFHNFSTDSFASILSEARKYRLNLTLSHQYIRQLRPEVADAVFGNVGSLVVFRVGDADGERLQRELGDSYNARTLTGLDNFNVCARLLGAGVEGEAFLGTTFDTVGQRFCQRVNIVQRSRQRFAAKRDIVEDRIGRWLRFS